MNFSVGVLVTVIRDHSGDHHAVFKLRLADRDWLRYFRQFHNALLQKAYEQPVPSILQATGVLYPSLRIPPFSLMLFRFSSKSLRVIALPFKS